MNHSTASNEIDLIRQSLYQFNTEQVGDDSHTSIWTP